MNIFNLFGRKAENDPYWKFDETEHFRPKLNKGDFFKLTGFDFGWFVLQPISKFVGAKENELERGKSMSYGQKALYYWWYLDAQVTNGGFVQFYYNGYGHYAATIIKGLKHIGDDKMAALVKKADKIYQKKKKLVEKAQQTDLFDSDLYDQLDGMSPLDDAYYELHDETMSKIEQYMRQNPNEICLDEEGKEFDNSYTGICQTFYDDKCLKEEFFLEKGVLNGEFKSFHENGNLKENIKYLKGEQSGQREEYFSNGKLKYQASKVDAKPDLLLHQWYHENGNPKKLESKTLASDESFGEYKEWHENGQLSESGTYKSDYDREGEWLEFYPNGNKKVEAEFIEGDFKLIHHWNEQGEQKVLNGTGVYVYEKSLFDDDEIDREEHEYLNYKRHGIQKSFTNDRLTLYQEMENGEEHGITRSYYNNGKIEKETVYKNGKEVSEKIFPKFENPIVVTTIICKMKDEWLTNRELETADSYPIPINKEVLEKEFEVELSIFDGYPKDYTLNYRFFVSIGKTGKPTEIDFLSAHNAFILDEVKANIEKMEFKPAQKNGENVNSYLIISHELELGE